MSINPADWWGPEPKAIEKPSGGRVVRLCTDDDEEPQQQQAAPEKLPFIAGDAMNNPRVTRIPKREDAMPKGQYDRSKAKKRGKPADDAATATQEPVRKARGAKTPRKAKKTGASAARPATNGGARFGVYSDGSVVIETGACKGTLSGEDAAALVAFIARLKGE